MLRHSVLQSSCRPSISKQPPNVRRTRTSMDDDISPFVLDPSSVSLIRKRSSGEFHATYLLTPAKATPITSHREALFICDYMDQLRHPHLEQFIGVVTDQSLRNHFIITERQNGRSLAHYLENTSKNGSTARLSVQDVLQIASQCSLGLHYLHQTTRTGHHALCAHSIVHNRSRGKTVVLLTNECKECHVKKLKASRKADVLTISKLITGLLNPFHQKRSGQPHHDIVVSVQNQLQLIISKGNPPSQTMGEMCEIFSAALNKLTWETPHALISKPHLTY